MKTSFINFFTEMAVFISQKSKDPNTKCGAVIVGPNNEVRSVGYNGLPRGLNDEKRARPERHSREADKYKFYEHAERNAIFNAARSGIGTDGCTMFITGHPCADCARAIIQCGIKEIFIGSNVFKESPTGSSVHGIDIALEMLKEAGVTVHEP